MKTTLKKVSLFGFLFAWSLWVSSLFSSIYAANAADVTINPNLSPFEHITRLHSIYFDHANTKVWIKAWTWKLNILNWLAVSSNDVATLHANSKWVVIGWWSNNKIDWSNSWIWWWYKNTIEGINNIAAIGWGRENTTRWNYSVVAWGYNNTAEAWGVAIWWSNTTSKGNGVALWWNNNKAEDNSLALWVNSLWNSNSFAWNATAQANKARINASNWVLIWTYTPVRWAKLVVNGPIKLNGVDNSASWIKWEIKVDTNGCIYAYYKDWNMRHVLGRASWASCWEKNTCKFGKTILQDGDTVKAYNSSFAVDCGGWTDVTCNNWTLSRPEYVYPYCYSLGRSML